MAEKALSSSDKSSTTTAYSVQDQSNKCPASEYGEGNIVFTGPDGNSDYKVNILSPDHIGLTDQSREHTGNLSYLWRAARNTPFPRPRRHMANEIGSHSMGGMDRRLLESKNQITLGEFRGQCQDRFTHRYQNPWYPKKPRPKSHPGKAQVPDDLAQVPIKQQPRTTSAAASTVGPLQNVGKKVRPFSPSSSSSSSFRQVPQW